MVTTAMIAPRRFAVCLRWALLSTTGFAAAWNNEAHHQRRRQLFTDGASSLLLVVAGSPQTVAASPSTGDTTATLSPGSLSARLAQRDAAVLKNRVFNLPPGPQVYPDWMRGDWQVESKFSGFLFPSTAISKERITKNVGIAGFQKCSIATTADVGKENVSYTYRINKDCLEDRVLNLQSSIDAYLDYRAVKDVLYDAKSNPNRISIDFVDYKTVNAERIELFCNARESESYVKNGSPVFACAEYVRQVTFGTGSTVGVPRQVVTNYANFWTWVQQPDQTLKGNLLTAAYLDPQDPMYFEEPLKPVAVYSHVLSATRKATP